VVSVERNRPCLPHLSANMRAGKWSRVLSVVSVVTCTHFSYPLLTPYARVYCTHDAAAMLAGCYASQSVKAGATKSLRKCLILHRKHLPILYIDHEHVQDTKNVNLEHVVPSSRFYDRNATRDARNIFLADAYINMARGNSRYKFEVPAHNRTGLKHLGHGNYIDIRERAFYPREKVVSVLFSLCALYASMHTSDAISCICCCSSAAGLGCNCAHHPAHAPLVAIRPALGNRCQCESAFAARGTAQLYPLSSCACTHCETL